MSILATLRYPISIPPTEAELAVLPNDIYHYWCSTTFMMNFDPARIARAYELLFKLNSLRTDGERALGIQNIQRLRTLIYNMDE